MDTIIQILARELGRSEAHVENVVRLIDEGNTIPFIARYRKELHGAMDDTALRTGRPAAIPAQSGQAAGGGQVRHRGPGQADGGALRRHRRRRHPGGGGGSLPPL